MGQIDLFLAVIPQELLDLVTAMAKEVGWGVVAGDVTGGGVEIDVDSGALSAKGCPHWRQKMLPGGLRY